MKKAYVTVLANDAYLKGALVLNESLKKVKSKYELVVFCGKDLTDKAKNDLRKENIKIVEQKEDLKIPEILMQNNNKSGFEFWNNTFLKLHIFELTEYEKMVFLDCDVVVLQNIDDLFEAPNKSSVPYRLSLSKSIQFSSGLFVFEPKEGALQELNEILFDQKIENDTYFGDQSIIENYWKNWAKEEYLHLDQTYHIIFGDVHHYKTEQGCSLNGEKSFKVIHFPGKKKPWMNPITHIEHYVKFIFRKKWTSFRIFAYYDELLFKVNFKLFQNRLFFLI